MHSMKMFFKYSADFDIIVRELSWRNKSIKENLSEFDSGYVINILYNCDIISSFSFVFNVSMFSRVYI